MSQAERRIGNCHGDHALISSVGPALDLPKRLSDAYARSAGSHRFAVRDQNAQLLFGSGPEIGPIPSFGGQLTQTVYEARLLRRLAKENKVATQMGIQGSAEDGLRRQ